MSEEAFVLPPLSSRTRNSPSRRSLSSTNGTNEAVVVLLLLFFSVGVVRGVTDNARFHEPLVHFLTLAVPSVQVNVCDEVVQAHGGLSVWPVWIVNVYQARGVHVSAFRVHF